MFKIREYFGNQGYFGDRADKWTPVLGISNSGATKQGVEYIIQMSLSSSKKERLEKFRRDRDSNLGFCDAGTVL